ncbi:MAG: AAA family ATPase [Elusimicrobiota bacterium]|nr:AAA family ATPase [Endomicrobiia bacterium]MDW8165657.1 AAA family ATPase [Elusimicrobiota bacterium]
MTKRIAVCGKGGVGKTTVICGILNYLLEKQLTPILVVDADPNSNLAENLGVKYEITIADIREEIRNSEIPSYTSKADYINMRLQEAISEQNGFDLIVMGRPEGKECYCFVNELLRTFLSNLSKNYKYVLIDTEAGMEHFSRRTTDNIDVLIIITTPTKTSIQTVKKILEMLPKLKLKILSTKILLNFKDTTKNETDINIDGYIHTDNKIYQYSELGIPLLNNLNHTQFYNELKQFLNTIILNN